MLLFAAYLIAGKLGLRLATVFPSATPVWPATGIAFAALLLLGLRYWPAIFVGAFVVNITTAGTPFTSLGIAAGNTLEALLGAWLVARFAGGRDCFRRPESIFRFFFLAALGSTLVSAVIGVGTLWLAELIPTTGLPDVGLTWWLGDAAGNVLVAPVLVAWVAHPAPQWDRTRVLEVTALFTFLVVTAAFVFGGAIRDVAVAPPPTFFCIPFLVWAAMRLGVRKAATATLILAAFAIWGTLNGHGSFARYPANSGLLLLQAYMMVAAMMTLVLSAAVAQAKEVEDQLRRLTVTDPLTGIANYRQLILQIEKEVSRAGRTERPFALIFMDVDGLKAINDRHGHLAGSRALCRVAEVLTASAREVDTAARYGGDEFALLLPETTEAEAAQVARRLTDRLAAATEAPGVRVSIGIAEHPRDGHTADALIGAADRRLYEARALVRGDGPARAVAHPPRT